MIANAGPMIPIGLPVPLPASLGGTGDTGTAWPTFTPTITPGSGAVAGYSTQSARYKAIGKTVFVQINIQASGVGTASGAYTISGLPFAAAGGGARSYLLNVHDGTTGLYAYGYVIGGTTVVTLFTRAAATRPSPIKSRSKASTKALERRSPIVPSAPLDTASLSMI